MSPWRRRVAEGSADRFAIARIVIIAVLVSLLLAALLLAGCALAPAISCPLGTYQAQVEAETSVGWEGDASVSVPTGSGSGKASGASKSTRGWTCRRICPSGTAVKLRESGKGRHLECTPLPCPEPARPMKKLERDAGASTGQE